MRTQEEARRNNRERMRKSRKKERILLMISKGYCPFCTMLVESEYHKEFPCDSYLHAKVDSDMK